MTNIEICDDQGNDGIEVFDLDSKDNEAINSVSPGNYLVSYHTSLSDAQNGINSISGNYTNTSNPELIFVSIEDIDNNCIIINQFQLIVNPPPTISQPPLLEVCDSDNLIDGFTAIDLSQADSDIINGQNN